MTAIFQEQRVGARQDDQTQPGGSMPTSGANRPGPMRPRPAKAAEPAGTHPVAIRLERLGIDAAVETAEFEAEQPVPPSLPELTAWYQRSSLLGVPGVILIGGLTTIEEAGPSAFTRLSEANSGDLVELTGANGGTFTYALESVDPQAAPPDFPTLLAQRDLDRLVLIGWDGDYPAPGSGRTLVLAAGVRQP
jgi:hypothetical protein